MTRNLGPAEFGGRGICVPAEFDVFHSNNYFFTENDLSCGIDQIRRGICQIFSAANCGPYILVIKIINSTVYNKLLSYIRISALGPDGHCTSRFKSDVYFGAGGGSGSWGRMWTGKGGSKIRFLW